MKPDTPIITKVSRDQIPVKTNQTERAAHYQRLISSAQSDHSAASVAEFGDSKKAAGFASGLRLYLSKMNIKNLIVTTRGGKAYLYADTP